MDSLSVNTIKLNVNYVEIGVTLTPEGSESGRSFTYYYPKSSTAFELVESIESDRGRDVIRTNINIRYNIGSNNVTVLETDLTAGRITDGATPPVAYSLASLITFLVTNTGA